jgi:hypothetical protein
MLVDNGQNDGNGYIALKTSQDVFSSLVFLVMMKYWRRTQIQYLLSQTDFNVRTT